MNYSAIFRSSLLLVSSLLIFSCEKNPAVVETDELDESVFIVSNESINFSEESDVPISNPEYPDNFLRSLVIHSHVANNNAFPGLTAFSVFVSMSFQKNNGDFADLGQVSFGNVPLFSRDTLKIGQNSHRIFGYRGLIQEGTTPTSFDTLGLWLLFNTYPHLRMNNSSELNNLDAKIQIKPTIYIKEIVNSEIDPDRNIEIIFNRNLTAEHTLISISTEVSAVDAGRGETGFYNFTPLKARDRIRVPKRFLEHLVRISNFRHKIRIWVAERTLVGIINLSPKANPDQQLALPVGRISTYLLELNF
ncbi:MAG: hypothetical protein KDD94_09500 [Calditrichaeota bacterium]|nr:hypothetical protein [Calditrichota bacterium]